MNWKEKISFRQQDSGFHLKAEKKQTSELPDIKTRILAKLLPDGELHRPEKADIPAIAAGILAIGTISYLFYHSFIAAALLSPLLLPFYEKMRRERIQKENHEIGQQFKDALTSVVTSQKAGYSIENAFVSSYQDMTKLYGEQSPICKELRRVCKGLRNNIVLEQLLAEMGKRTLNPYIREFANVFAVAKRTGGNITQMLEETVSEISNQTEVEKEIDVMISAGKMEARIMEVIPFAIIAYVGATNDGFLDGLYGNAAGIILMTACLIVYFVAYIWIEKTIEVEI